MVFICDVWFVGGNSRTGDIPHVLAELAAPVPVDNEVTAVIIRGRMWWNGARLHTLHPSSVRNNCA